MKSYQWEEGKLCVVGLGRGSWAWRSQVVLQLYVVMTGERADGAGINQTTTPK
jgi:hypothetical protein